MLKKLTKSIFVTAFALLSFTNINAKEVKSSTLSQTQITAEFEGRAVIAVRLIYHNGKIIGYVLIYSDGSSDYYHVN